MEMSMTTKELEENIRSRLMDYMASNSLSSVKVEKITGISRHTILSFLHRRGKTRILTLAKIQLYLEQNEHEMD